MLGGSRIDQLLELGMQLLVQLSLKILNLPHSLSAWQAADATNPGPSRKPLVNAKGQPFPDLAWVLSDCVALALEALSFVASVSETSAQEVKSRGGVMLACEHFIWSQQQAQQHDDPDRSEHAGDSGHAGVRGPQTPRYCWLCNMRAHSSGSDLYRACMND